MNTSLLLAAAAVLMLAPAAQAKPVLAGRSPAAAKIVGADRTLDVLYDQHGADSGIGILSQNFESSFDAYDSQAADDFIVPKGAKWSVREIDAAGVYFNGKGPAASVNVFFYYRGKGHKPGEVRASYAEILPSTDNGGSFVLALPKRVRLHPGRYWLSVQANMDVTAGGEWGWENQTTVVGLPAQWRNTGGGLGVCPEWAQEDTCISAGQGDHIFTLRGRLIP